ncbi:SET domain-containing protein [Daedaleopsis nitida]|nr:SET domain-containing protein [Daedaleopsis nitida]
MSFGKLKSARRAKESHSFVQPLPADGSTSPIAATASSSYLSSGTPRHTTPAEHVLVELTQVPDDRTQALDTQVLSGTADVSTHEDSTATTTATPASTSLQSAEKETSRPAPLHGCHAVLPSTLEIRESSRHGRAVYTKSAISAGSVILSVTPHVSVLATSGLDQHCSACARSAPGTGLKRCPKCRTVWYCDSECQNRDWASHKRECGALQKWAAAAPSPDVAIPGEAVRCLGRILWGSQKEGLDSVWAKEIRMMHSNRTSLQPSVFESHTHLAHSLVRYLGVSSPQELEPYGLTSAGDLVDLISRFATNTFTLTEPSLTPIGICVAPTIALANHSCDPNAVIVFPRPASASAKEEPLLHLIALRDIAAGKEVRISYVDTTLPQRLRQKELKEVYNFTCQCKLCTRTRSADPREAMWCPKGCGGTCPIPTEEDGFTRCVKCKAAIASAEAVLDAVRVGQEGLDKASTLQFRDVAKARQLTTNLIPIMVSAGLTPSSHPLLAMTRLHHELLLASLPSSPTQDTLDESIRATAKYSAGVQTLLPRGHPVRAVALGELGKLLAVDEPAPPRDTDSVAGGRFPPSGPARLKLAYECLVRAHEEMLIGYGKSAGGGELGREVRDAIVRLEAEIGVWTVGIKNAWQDAVAEKAAK